MANYLLSHTGAQIDEGIDAALNIDSTIASRIGSDGPAAGRNLVDNADFRIWTRGSSVTIADGAFQCCADRYNLVNACGTSATATMAADVITIDGVSRTCGKVSMSAAVSSFASNKYIVPFMQIFEGRSAYRYLSPGKSFTVALAIEVSVAGKYAFTVRNADASYSYVHTATLAANTPTIVQFIVPIPTTAGIWNCPDTVNAGLRLLIGSVGSSQYAAPSTDEWVSGNYYHTADCVNWAATAGATIKVTRVRLEEGTVLGAYQAKTYEEDEARCRYFLPAWKGIYMPLGTGQVITSSTIAFDPLFSFPCRIPPTGALISSIGHLQAFLASGSPVFPTSWSFSSASTTGATIVIEGMTGLVAGNASRVRSNSASFLLLATGAEL